jgi:hypothetical protein
MEVPMSDYVRETSSEKAGDVPRATTGSERELTPEEHIALLKERNAKAREAINGLVAENARLRAELGRVNDDPMSDLGTHGE